MDVIQWLKKEHDEIEGLFRRAQTHLSNDTRGETARTAVRDVVREFSRHAAIKEQALYPVVRTNLPDGPRLVREALREQQAAKQSLSALQSLSLDAPEFGARLEALRLDFKHHSNKEEAELSEKLREWLGREWLRELTRELEESKPFAPTRPHPFAPNRPPVNVVTNLAAAAVDRVLDAADEGRELVWEAAEAAFVRVRDVVQDGALRLRRKATKAAVQVQDVAEEGRSRVVAIAKDAGIVERQRRRAQPGARTQRAARTAQRPKTQKRQRTRARKSA